MGWSDLVPILTDEMVAEAAVGIQGADREEFEQLFGVDRVINPSKGAHVLSLSLFCKTTNADEQEIAAPTEELLRNPLEHGVATRFNPWEHYVEPVLQWAPRLREEFPDLAVRVYLASDLEFLVGPLSEACEVMLMKSASIRSAPGMLWRFLALEDHGGMTTVLDADLLESAAVRLRVTERLEECGLGFWRVPVPFDYQRGEFFYRPMAGCYWGSRVPLPVRELLASHLWHLKRGTLGTEVTHPIDDSVVHPMFGSRWPDYGADEFFLSLAVYPRLAQEGCLTILDRSRDSMFLPLDVEYVTWANSRSAFNAKLHRPVTRWSETQKERHKKESRNRRRVHRESDGTPDDGHSSEPLRLHFCRDASEENDYEGWERYSFEEFNFSRSLPFCDGAATRILVEHVVESMPAKMGWTFLSECRRILAPDGVLRVLFFDLARLFENVGQPYLDYLKAHGWGDGTPGAAVEAALFDRKFRSFWSAELMVTLLKANGFKAIVRCEGESAWPEFRGLEPLPPVRVPDSRLETTVMEARKSHGSDGGESGGSPVKDMQRSPETQVDHA